MQHTTETPKQYQCRHIFTDDRRCASPCLRQEEFCYYHHTTRKPVANPRRRRCRSSAFHLPLPEDRSAIQASIGEVLQRIAANDIDPRRAGLLLYGLQIASLNLPKPQTAQPRGQKIEQPETVEEITIDPALGILAPRAEVSAITQRKSPVTLLIESMLQSEKEEEEAANPGIDEVVVMPVTIPTLQAAADDSLSPNQRTVISTEAAHGLIVSSAVEKSAVAFVVACSPQRHPKIKTLISTGGGRNSCVVVTYSHQIFRQTFTASIPRTSQLQNPKFPTFTLLKPPTKTPCILYKDYKVEVRGS